MSFGWLGDRFEKRRISAVGLALTAVGLLFFSFARADEILLLTLFLVVFGTGWGGNVTMRAALLREYYGRGSFGTIHGFTMGIMTLGTIVGAPFAGWIFDQWHNYQIAWIAIAIISAFAVVIMLTAPLSSATSGQLVEKKTI
jgi:MFS family permease